MGKIRVVLDATIFNSFSSCEQHFNLRHNHNLVPISGMGRAIEMGSMMHDMLEEYYRAKKLGADRVTSLGKAIGVGNLIIKSCEQCIKKICTIHKDNKFHGLQSTDIDEAHLVMQTMEQYHEFWKNDSWTTIEVEHVVGKVIYEDDDLSVLWKAKVDWLIDNLEGLFSTDHKTMSKREDVLDLDNQFIGQTIVTGQTKMFRNVVGFQKSLKPHEKFFREAVNYSKARQAEWILETASYAYDMANCVENKRYRHRLTSCRRRYGDCIFRHVCQGEPSDRQRLLNEQFKVAEKVWDVGND